jgi:NhaC family Na+:H+ antiporter
MTESRPPKQMSFAEAAAPFATMLTLFVGGSVFLDTGPSTIVVAMLGAAAVAAISAVRRGARWADVERSAAQKFAWVLPVVLILLSIGMLIGAWMLSGTIPFLVAIGLRLVDPQFLVLTAFLATAVMSVATGTSWGSAGTIGVALMGMAAALDAPLPVVAGAVVSGAYFGDKLSPLSDTTNIAAISVGIPLYRHIRHLLYTAVPSFAVAVVAYLALGGGDGGATSAKAAALIAEIDRVYDAPLLATIPPIVVILSVAARKPPVLGIAASALVAALIGVFAQGFSAADAVAAAMEGFRAPMIASTGADPTVVSEAFAALVERGGVYSMANTLIVILAAFLLAGAMDVSGALDALVRRLLALARSTFGLIAATSAASAMTIALISHFGVTALLVGGLFKDAYAKRDLAPENLSRTLEDSAAIVEPLLPWTVSAVYMAGVVGVPTLEYAPWAFFCYTGTLFTLLLAAAFDRTGFGLKRAQLQVAASP